MALKLIRPTEFCKGFRHQRGPANGDPPLWRLNDYFGQSSHHFYFTEGGNRGTEKCSLPLEARISEASCDVWPIRSPTLTSTYAGEDAGVPDAGAGFVAEVSPYLVLGKNKRRS